MRHKTKLGRTEANNGGDDYCKARNEMTSFTVKNVQDDAADSMTMLADYLANGIKTVLMENLAADAIALSSINGETYSTGG